MAKNFDELEHKSFKFVADSVDEEAGFFTGYASTFGDIDLTGDIVVRGAFKKTLTEHERFPLNWSHDVMHPLGIIMAEEDKRGLKVRGELNMDVQSAREKRSLMKQGAITGMSIGYRAINPTFDKVTGARLLKEIQLGEISLCEFPACPSAQVLAVKTAEPSDTKANDALDVEPGQPTPSVEPQPIKAEPVEDHSYLTYAEAVKEFRQSIERS